MERGKAMGKNILIFCDGTGQAGGLLPDEVRSNVYKLFRAARCGPDSTIDPMKQVAFYDPGIGSKAAHGSIKIGWARFIVNILCQMTGLGLTRNIVDCYAAIIDLWKPEDRIYLFGFSRGAYTARCVGGVLRLCGVPKKGPNDEQLASPSAIKAVAREAVKKVYQHGASKAAKRFQNQRDDLAAAFRKKYDSDEKGVSNAVPYFIGVWDTVAALGMTFSRLIWLFFITVPLTIAVLFGTAWAVTKFVSDGISQMLAAMAPEILGYWTPFGTAPFVPLGKVLLIIGALTLIVSYLWTHIKWATGTRDPLYKTFHIVAWQLKFYDQSLSDRVKFARHALSIDERRKDFARVEWANAQGIHDDKNDGINWFEQIWFAGNHSDIGGGYTENESRLSDIALKWMTDEARRIPCPIIVNNVYLQAFPLSNGVMHDECKRGLIPWFKKLRDVPNGAYLHGTVFDRLAMDKVRNCDTLEKYDPIPLRNKKVNRYDPIPLNPIEAHPKPDEKK
jgi:uncharacterized protein (DUF2235 family)